MLVHFLCFIVSFCVCIICLIQYHVPLIWQAYHSYEIKPQRLVQVYSIGIGIEMEEPEGSNQKGIKKEVLYYLLVLQPVCTVFFGCCQQVLFFECCTCYSLIQVFQSRGWSAKSPRLFYSEPCLPSPTLPHCGCLKLLIIPMRRVLPVSHFL